MSCLHPKKGFPIGLTKNGKPKLKIVPYNVKSLTPNGELNYLGIGETDHTQYYEIPCGHCIGCRIDQGREWSDRLLMEMEYHDSVYYLTLTYDEEHLPRVTYTNEMTGEIKNDRGTLNKRDVQLFVKRLRKHRPEDKVRYYFVGEYGPNTDRPHYHGIVYGIHIGDWHLVEYGLSKTGQMMYTCGEIESIWRNGVVYIEPANEYAMKYVCNYVTKKLREPDGTNPRKAKGQLPEFALQSRRPGIGRAWFDERGDELVTHGRYYISTDNGSCELHPPRYFKKLYREAHEDDYAKIVEKHLIAMSDSDDAKTTITDLEKQQWLLNEEYSIKKKTNNRDSL